MNRTRMCYWCGEDFVGYPGKPRGKRTFCSQACRNAWMGYFNTNENRVNREGGLTEDEKAKIAASRRDQSCGLGYRKVHGLLEHRLVAERVLGRSLAPGEVVHHIDGNKQNNAPENLVVFSNQSAHMSHHLSLKGGKL